MRNNITSLIKDELVKQFENVVKQEIASHNLAIQRSNESLQEYRKALDAFAADREVIRKQNELLHDQTRQEFRHEKKVMVDSFDEQRRHIRTLRQRLAEDVEEIKGRLAGKATTDDLTEMAVALTLDLNRAVKPINERLKSTEITCFEECKNQDSLNDEHRKYVEYRLQKLVQQIEEMKGTVEVAGVDCAGVLKELQVYKKHMFIIERKIEDLYNQVERIKRNNVPNCS